MAAQPPPVRDTVVDKIADLLAAIVKPTYDFQIGSQRVYRTDRPLSELNAPAVKIVQRIEREAIESYDKNARALLINVGFVFAVSRVGGDVDGQGSRMIENIERALGYQHTIVVTPDGGVDSDTTVNGSFFIRTLGSALNITKPMRNKFGGQVDIEANYQTTRLDPRRV